MINQDITSKLVKIYFFVCEKYKNELQYCCQRFRYNNTPEFTDHEIMTICLFSVHLEQRFRIKQMYNFIKNYFFIWFPKLPSYVAFNIRINNLCEAFRILSDSLLKEFVLSMLANIVLVCVFGEQYDSGVHFVKTFKNGGERTIKIIKR